jgi:2-dehydro-3-deoxygluconokinase
VSAVDVVSVGETMIVLTPEGGETLSHSASLAAYIGGAESNVAMNLARLGLTVRWASVVSEDPLGRRVAREIAGAGVDVSAIVWSRNFQTGLYLKDPGPDSTEVFYYRQGSAARTLDQSIWLDERLRYARVLHVTGITPALSQTARIAIEAAVIERSARSEIVSFDVNYRRGLWSVGEAAPVLQRLANAADIVFVGLDEATVLWGCTSAEAVRDVLPDAHCLVVKDGAIGAYAFTPEGRDFVEARSVSVVEPTGAGDAFAAGFLKGTVDGAGTAKSLRLGHLLAARALESHGDVADPPPADWLAHELTLSDDEWGRRRFESLQKGAS